MFLFGKISTLDISAGVELLVVTATIMLWAYVIRLSIRLMDLMRTVLVVLV